MNHNELKEHMNAINELITRINITKYSTRSNLLMLDPDWIELKEHINEMMKGR